MIIPYNKELTAKARELRRNQTIHEIKLWNYILRVKQLEGYKFLRQKPILNFIVDFYCSKLLLVIELDGVIHDYRISYDNQRDAEIIDLGIKIIRFKNNDIENNIDKVRFKLLDEIDKRENEILQNPLLSPLTGGE